LPAPDPGASREPLPPEPDLARGFEPALDPSALASLRALDRGAGEILRVMLDLFLDDGYERVLLIEDSIATRSPHRLRTYAHQLASSAAQLGAAHLVAVCLDLERLGARGGATRAAVHMDALRKAFDLAEAEIHAILADGD
jgi:HPt (histidine-containing phosphotransfer) domain-containing protein